MNAGRQSVDMTLKNGTRVCFCGIINEEIHGREIFNISRLVIDGEERDIFSPQTWMYMLFNCKLTHDAKGIKGSLLSELSMSKHDIPKGILEIVYYDGLKKGRYKNLDDYLSLCSNTDVLDFLLEKGARFKTRWRRPSSMEHWFYNVGMNYDSFSKFIDLIMKYQMSIDMRWVRKNGNRIVMCMQKFFEWGNERKNPDDFKRGNFLLYLAKNNNAKYYFTPDANSIN